ncbi:MAG: methyltransferase [Gemmataceae bacterium]|nr:methyltransferase [Gemmataceae bacterium]
MSDRPPRAYVDPDQLQGLIREKVILHRAQFLIDRPGDIEELLDLPCVQSAFAQDEYMPYWADVWPAARMLARAVLERDWPAGQTALEIGCGLGIAGLAALSRGLRVVFSDYDLTAVAFAVRNAALNGFTDFSARPFDWRDPPADLRVPIILGSDVTYEDRSIDPLLNVLARVLEPGGTVLLTDQNRPPAARLTEELERRGWVISRRPMRAANPGQRRAEGTLYEMVRPS